MGWLRRSFVHLLSFLLLVGLLGGALTTSAKLNLSHPDKIEGWLDQSQLYDHFVNGIIEQSDKETFSGQSGSVSLSDAAVQKAVRSAFPPQLLKQNVDTFLESNYAWLEGKTAIPEFKIDLTGAKQNFAEQVGQYVRVYTAGLPGCTPAQLIALQGQQVDPLSAACRPSTITPEAAGTEVTRQLANSGDFLSDPVVTARTINPEKNSQPYYEKLHHLPRVYQLAGKLPLVFGILSLVSAIGILFIAFEKRTGLRRIAIMLAISGIGLIGIKVIADSAMTRVEQKVFNTANNGQLQQSLTDFAHHVETALVKTDLLFGIGFIVLAVVGFMIVLRTGRTDSTRDALDRETAPLSSLPEPVSEENSSDTPEPKPPKSRPPRLVQ